MAAPEIPSYALPWPRGPMMPRHPFARAMGELICDMRLGAALTQAALAAALETTQPAISKLEAGRHAPSLGMLIRIAEATQTPLRVNASFRGKAFFRDSVDLWPLPEEPTPAQRLAQERLRDLAPRLRWR